MDMFMIDLSEIERYKNESWNTVGGRLPGLLSTQTALNQASIYII